jgi:hypothetical protein
MINPNFDNAKPEQDKFNTSDNNELITDTLSLVLV